MPRSPFATTSLLAVAVALLAACDGSRSAPAATVTPARTVGAAAAGPQNKALGLGEARSPEPYTTTQRLLDAASSGDRVTIERALERGATLAAKDDIGRGVVIRTTMDSGDVEVVRWLHEKGAPLDEPDGGGRSALSFAAGTGRLPIVRYLVEHGAVVDRRDAQQQTPLFHAALDDHGEVIAYLHEHGAEVNVRDMFGDTPLIMACSKGNDAAAKALLALGADASVKDQEGRSAKDRADASSTVCRNLPS